MCDEWQRCAGPLVDINPANDTEEGLRAAQECLSPLFMSGQARSNTVNWSLPPFLSAGAPDLTTVTFRCRFDTQECEGIRYGDLARVNPNNTKTPDKK